MHQLEAQTSVCSNFSSIWALYLSKSKTMISALLQTTYLKTKCFSNFILFFKDSVLWVHFYIHSKIEEGVRRFLFAPDLIHQYPLRSGGFVTTHGPALIRHWLPKPSVYTGDCSWGCTSIGLGKCLMTWLHHNNVTQSDFSALANACALSIHSEPPTSGKHWTYCVHGFFLFLRLHC